MLNGLKKEENGQTKRWVVQSGAYNQKRVARDAPGRPLLSCRLNSVTFEEYCNRYPLKIPVRMPENSHHELHSRTA